MTAHILAIGSYLPEKEVVNADLTQFPPETLPLIEQKTGVKARRHAAADQTTSDLAFLAARSCLAQVDFPADAVDALVLATSSPDRIQPATATRVQHLLGARRAFAFDVNSVCTGALYALAVGRSLILSGECAHVLVVAAETYSRFLNPNDFATYPYFGDGAGAVLLGRGPGRLELIDGLLRSDGSGADVIQVPAGGSMMPLHALRHPNDVYFKMNGRKVFDFAVSRGSEIIGELLKRAGRPPADVGGFITHQANINIIHGIAAKLGLPPERFFSNLERVGNTAAASVFIALDERLARQPLAGGEYLVLASFGGGLSWGAFLLQSPESNDGSD